MDAQQFYLCTHFQNGMELAEYWSELPAPEQKPYDNKYKAIEILKELKPGKYAFILNTLLGDIYNDVDQTNDSVKSYQVALESISSLPKETPFHNYYNYLINIYNMLGLTYLNRENNEEGVSLLGKASLVYEAFNDIKGGGFYHNRNKPIAGKEFRYYYEGGLDSERMEDSFTLTQFYLAQAYTKLGFKDKAAEFCGHTLQRQFTTKKYELKEFISNIINLADYYTNNKLFAQSQYLLMSGLKLLPQGKKPKTHANLYIALGNLLKELLGFCSNHIRNQLPLEANADDIVSRKIFEFAGIALPFPRVNVARDLEGCKSLFRQANTQYKKAMDIYVLDGYVTEHIDILFSQSKLYQYLCLIEESPERIIGMLEKRKELMLPILKQLNPKAYQNTWERILVECAQIMNELFDWRFRQLSNLGKDKVPSESKIKTMNECGLKAIEHYRQIQKVLLQSTDVDKNQAYYQSIINAKFNQAKAYSKLYSPDSKIRVEYLKKALEIYTDLGKFITKTKQDEKFKESFKKEESMTAEMVGMLPAKIDRVNYGYMEGQLE